jgi:hypothetical protein
MDEGKEVCRCCDGVGLMMGCDSDGLVDCDCWEIGWDGCWGVL